MKENRPEQRIKFRTRKQSESKSLRRFALVLAAVLVFGGAVSVFLFLRNYNFDLSEVFEGTHENSEETTTQPAPLNIKNINCDILVFCAPNNRERIDFISLVKVKMPENSFTVFSFSPSEKADYSDPSTALAQVYHDRGIDALKTAVAGYSGITPDKYVCFNDTAFKVIADRYGPYKITVDPGVEYKGSDFVFILPKGRHTMGGDMLLKYIRCLPSVDFSKAMITQSDIIKMIISAALVPENSGNLINSYSSLANHLTTDISIVEFSGVADSVKAMMESENIRYITVTSAAEYIEN
ncbi:MAG: LCP family protein [Clostridia bacterium]|nr:LCP family protein [Clostridia bacterium]